MRKNHMTKYNKKTGETFISCLMGKIPYFRIFPLFGGMTCHMILFSNFLSYIVVLVALTMWYSEKMMVSTRCIHKCLILTWVISLVRRLIFDSSWLSSSRVGRLRCFKCISCNWSTLTSTLAIWYCRASDWLTKLGDP